MSGQIPESYAVLRATIEQAWYALHIDNDPQPPNRAKVWVCRNDDEASKKKCKSEFTVVNVRSTHESLDPATAKQLSDLYESMIDFGAHPNQLGLLMAMSKSKTHLVIQVSRPWIMKWRNMAVLIIHHGEVRATHIRS